MEDLSVVSPAVALLKKLIELEVVSGEYDPTTLEGNGEGVIRELARRGELNECDALNKLAEAFALPFLDLDDPQILGKTNFLKFAQNVDNNTLWEHKLLPLWQDQKTVTAALINPYDIEGPRALEFRLGITISPVLAEETKLVRALTEHFPPSQQQFDYLDSLEQGDYVELLSQADNEENLDEYATDAPPIVRLANKIISDAVNRNASDIHVEPQQKSVEIRFRIDGVMQSILEVPKRLQPYLLSRLKIISGMDIAERRKPQDGRLQVRVANTPIDMRVSSIPTPHGEKLVLRVLRQDNLNLMFSSLGVPAHLEQELFGVLDKRGKLFLVTGPTGSGKTTLLYTCVNYLRDGRKNIETVEDPIEYRMSGIHQVQVNQAAGVTFASALRSILRQDPDIIMIGEIRDEETSDIALQAAQTGHLVLSTLHTNDAPSAVSRLLNLGADPFLVGSTLEGVLAQRLVRKLCGSCKTKASDEYLKKFERHLDRLGLTRDELQMPVGCETCHQAGYSGRTGVFSYLPVTAAIEELIYQRAPLGEIESRAKEEGYQTLSNAALELVRKGITGLDEVVAYLSSAEASSSSSLEQPETACPVTENGYQNTGPAPTPKENSNATSITKPRVMLVEDNNDVREIMAMLLEKEMYEVIQAENGQVALEKVYESTPQVILCDLMMPVMDGKEFFQRMRSNAQTSEIPILFLTAADTAENEIDLLELGAEDFISKNAPSEVMLSRLRKVMKGLG